MGILALILVGLIAGALARIAMPGPDPGGIIVTIAVGILGALVGGFILSSLGGPGITDVNVPSVLVATLGSIVILVVYRLITRRAT